MRRLFAVVSFAYKGETSGRRLQISRGADKVSQAQLDLASQLDCLTHEQVQRLLPAVNNALAKEGFRMVQSTELGEVLFGKFDSGTGQFQYYSTGSNMLDSQACFKS